MPGEFRFLAEHLPRPWEARRGFYAAGLFLGHGQKARVALGKSGWNLIATLGFEIERLDNLTALLRSWHGRGTLAVILHETEVLGRRSPCRGYPSSRLRRLMTNRGE